MAHFKAESDLSLGDLLLQVRLEGLVAMEKFQQMEKLGQDVSNISDTLRKDGINLDSFGIGKCLC